MSLNSVIKEVYIHLTVHNRKPESTKQSMNDRKSYVTPRVRKSENIARCMTGSRS